MSRHRAKHEDKFETTRYSFTLTLSATELTDEISEAIYGLELDDALVGESDGNVFVDFDIEGTCYPDAILNAIEAVEKALAGIQVTGVHPPGQDAIEMANAFLKTRRSDSRAKWSKLLGT